MADEDVGQARRAAATPEPLGCPIFLVRDNPGRLPPSFRGRPSSSCLFLVAYYPFVLSPLVQP